MAQTIFQHWETLNPDNSTARPIGQQVWDFMLNGRAFGQQQIDTWEAKNSDMSDNTDTITLDELL